MLYLPEELLSRICHHLRSTGDYAQLVHVQSHDQLQQCGTDLQTLRAISSSSRACNRAAHSHLYFALDLRNQYGKGIPSRLQLFLRTVLERPKFATSLQRLYTEAWDDGSEVIEKDTTSLGAEILQLCKTAVENIGLSQQTRHRIQQGLQEYSTDAELTLLLCLCQNVKLFDFTAGMDYEDSILSDVLKETSNSETSSTVQFLPHLSELGVEHCDTEYTSYMDRLMPYLQLPSLQTFRGFAMSCDADLGLISQSARSNLLHLHLTDSLVDDAGIHSLLRAFPRLQTLEVELGMSTRGASRLAYDEVGKALRQRGTELRRFILNISEAFFVDDEDESGILGSLKELTKLLTISVPFRALAGPPPDSDDDDDDRASDAPLLADLLPNSLRTLHVSNIRDGGAGDNINEWLEYQLDTVLSDERLSRFGRLVVQRAKKPSARRVQQFAECAAKNGWDASESNDYWFIVRKQSKVVDGLHQPSVA